MTRLVALLAWLPGRAVAHSFGQVYNLPVPFWLYAWGASAALLTSFLIAAYYVGANVRPLREWTPGIPAALSRFATRVRLRAILKALSLGGLSLCIATGLFGTPSPYGNFNMTFFWIVFVLGFAYLSAVFGNFFHWLNPWRVLAAGVDRFWYGFASGRRRYPRALGYWPAFAFYAAFIWIELFGHTQPHSLAVVLGIYSLLNLAGVWLIGSRDWFRHCEFFSVTLQLVSRLAPIDRLEQSGADAGRWILRVRKPFVGASEQPTEHLSMLVVLLFMLSSTAFDGLHETELWRRWFWLDLYHAGLQNWVGGNPLAAFPRMRQLYMIWQSAWLLILPFAYLAIYWCFTAMVRHLSGSGFSTRALAHAFAPTLLPIVLVYNITHYYTLIQVQGVHIVSLVSDPFGYGWNLFGTADWLKRTIIPDVGTVWHVQVALIVLGHIVSVFLAHRVAASLFRSRRIAAISQLPMLLLMIFFTTAGLWILSQPLSGVR